MFAAQRAALHGFSSPDLEARYLQRIGSVKSVRLWCARNSAVLLLTIPAAAYRFPAEWPVYGTMACLGIVWVALTTARKPSGVLIVASGVLPLNFHLLMVLLGLRRWSPFTEATLMMSGFQGAACVRLRGNSGSVYSTLVLLNGRPVGGLPPLLQDAAHCAHCALHAMHCMYRMQ